MGEEQLREMRSSYYGLITECDENLGRVFEALERSGQRDNTVIVFTTVLIPQHRIDAWRCGLPGLLSDACVLMAGSRGAAGGPPPLRDFPPLPLCCRPPLCVPLPQPPMLVTRHVRPAETELVCTCG